MHPIFQRQLLDYRIFVVEQSPGAPFNRGALMNIGYREALKIDDFDCLVFHDVDLLPEDDRYENCSKMPKKLIYSLQLKAALIAQCTTFRLCSEGVTKGFD